MTFTPTTFSRFLFGFGVILIPLLWAQESRPPPTPVTRSEAWHAVVAELRSQGLAESQLPRVEDLDLPVAPALAGRSLKVASACWDQGPRRTQFRLECSAPGQCLPFLVYLHEPVRDSDPVTASAEIAGREPSCRLPSGPHPASGSHKGPEAAPKPALKPTVLRGDRATAIFVADHLRMTASVTCLDRGREGDIIRARAPDGHVFRARISGPAVLEALPQ
jgi:hypothetical protein